VVSAILGVGVYNLYKHSSQKAYERLADDINFEVSKDINMLMNY